MSKKFATLNDFRSEDNGRDSGGESDGEGQSFYVGGSEHSGQQVVGPSGRDPREQIFNAARRHGAEATSEPPETSGSSKKTAFSGTGARLNASGQENVEQAPEVEDEAGEVVVRLRMWEDGFSIEDGPLRAFNDPQNTQFLAEITQGRVPAELVQTYGRRPIDLRMERMSGPYQKPKVNVAFTGSGARLGSVVPNVVVNTPSMPATTKEDAEKALAQAQTEVGLDPASPVTQVQIRLPDGKRIVGKFNNSHTIAAIRTFVASAVPEMAFSPFQLMTTFPNKVVEDESLSLADAGLLNAVVMVKLVA